MSPRYVDPYVNFQGRAREAMEFYQKAISAPTGEPLMAR
jgi:uncharacterized glyoxalase superfamily protein PhnB